LAYSDQTNLDVLRPAVRWRAIVPGDNELSPIPRAIYVGVGGNIELEDQAGNIEVFENIAGGMEHPLQPKRILASGTTADNIIALYN
jgi:hypothetical protein